jgi:hypothetical protein
MFWNEKFPISMKFLRNKLVKVIFKLIFVSKKAEGKGMKNGLIE